MERARKMHDEMGISWVEALPQILDRYHDTPGETNLSPYKIFFGRERPLANRPYHPPRELGDAKEFVERMALVDKKVASIVNSKNQRDIERLNQGRRQFPRLGVGDRVWVKRPEGSGTNWPPAGLVRVWWLTKSRLTATRSKSKGIDSLKCQKSAKKGPRLW